MDDRSIVGPRGAIRGEKPKGGGRAGRVATCLAVAAALAAAVAACAPDESTLPEQGDDACSDLEDNDGDGRVDCEDPGCAEASACLEADPPPLERCDDAVDNDDDGDIDCADDDCADRDLCSEAPTREVRCSDDEDDDGDGLVDCADPDCEDHDVCAAVSG